MSEATRRQLRARTDIDDEDIDDIIGLAAELQEAQRRADAGPSMAEIQAVAGELDIEAVYIEQAVARLVAQREDEAAEVVAVALRKKERAKLVALAVVTLLGMAAVGLGAQVYLANNAVSRMHDSVKNVENAAAYVSLVLDRQVALVPQLIAVSGGDPTPLEERVAQMQAADMLSERLEISQTLNTELTRVLAALPPAENDTEAIQRLGLTHELTGIQNRLNNERTKLLRACSQWQTQRTPFETKWSWIVALGLVELASTKEC